MSTPKPEAERAVPKAGAKPAAKPPSSGGPPPMPTRAQMQVCQLLVMHDLTELTCRLVACIPHVGGKRTSAQLGSEAGVPGLFRPCCCTLWHVAPAGSAMFGYLVSCVRQS